MRDQVQVGLQPVIVIARDVAIAAVGDRARHTAELVPDGGSLAIRARRALDLERAGRDAPDKVLWKAPPQFGQVRLSIHAAVDFGRDSSSPSSSSSVRPLVSGTNTSTNRSAALANTP